MKAQTFNLKELYEHEYDRWLTEMVKLLKNRDLEKLDYGNLIEELETLGRSEKNALILWKNCLIKSGFPTELKKFEIK